MQDKKVSLCEYPGNVVILDDDANFTNALSLKLQGQFKTTVFNQAADAKNYFNTATSCIDGIPFVSHLQDDELDIDSLAYTVDYKKVLNLLGSVDRYNESTVLIVDYKMPDINGLDFLASVHNNNIKKVMLTAHDEQSLAVDAFNKGLIGKFLLKDPALLDGALIDELKDLNAGYFYDLTMRKLGQDIIFHLYNQEYKSIFEGWIENYNIHEYYRVDDFGSVVGVNDLGKLVWLAVVPESQNAVYMKAYDSISDQQIDNNSLMFLFSDVEKGQPPSEWHKYVYPVKGALNAKNEKLLYSVIEDESFSLAENKIKVGL